MQTIAPTLGYRLANVFNGSGKIAGFTRRAGAGSPVGFSRISSATEKSMSKKASSITNRNSDSDASNGSKKKLAHSICNSLPISSFHHQFLKRVHWTG